VKRLGLALLVAALAAGAQAQQRKRTEMTRAEGSALDSVLVALEHKDCRLAVDRLNEGLAKAYPGIFMLAGAMYEEGLCLKPDWARAERMYLRAHDAGHNDGLVRLVAGYAQGRRDPGAALWWAHRAPRLYVPTDCKVGADDAADPDRFVAAVRGWPRDHLNACLYTIGVTARVIGEVDYPATALGFALSGNVQMVFNPSAGAIEWRTLRVQEQQLLGVVAGETLFDRGSRSAQRAFETHMRPIGERALKAFDRPAAVPEAWQVKIEFAFVLE
jgi:hypothetical protein